MSSKPPAGNPRGPNQRAAQPGPQPAAKKTVKPPAAAQGRRKPAPPASPPPAPATGAGGFSRQRLITWAAIGATALVIAIAGIAWRMSQGGTTGSPTAATPGPSATGNRPPAGTAGAPTPPPNDSVPGAGASGAAAAPNKYSTWSDKDYWLKRLIPIVAANQFIEKNILAEQPYTESPYPTWFQSDGLGHLNTTPKVMFERNELPANELRVLKQAIADLERDKGDEDAWNQCFWVFMPNLRASRMVPYLLRYMKAGHPIKNYKLYAVYVQGLFQMGLEKEGTAALAEAIQRWPDFTNTHEMGNILVFQFHYHYYTTGDLAAMAQCLAQARDLDNDLTYYHLYKSMLLPLSTIRADKSWARIQTGYDPMWVEFPYDAVAEKVEWMKAAGVTPTARMLAAADPENKGQPAPVNTLLHRARYAYCTNSDCDLAIRLTTRAAKESEGHDWPHWLYALGAQAQYLCGYGRLEEARAVADRMEAGLPNLSGADEIVYFRQIEVADAFGDFGRANEYLQKIADVAQAAGTEISDHTLAAVARMKMHQGYYTETEDVLLQFAQDRTAGNNAAEMAQAWLDIGQCYLAQKKYEQAVEALTNCESKVMQQIGVDYPIDVAVQVDSLVDLAYAYLGVNRLDQADEMLGRAKTASERGQAEDRWWQWQTGYASFYLQAGNLPDAQKWIDAALKSVEKQQANLRDYHSRGSLFNNKSRTFGVAIKIALEKKDLNAAFLYAEMSRARGFLDELGQHAAKVTLPKPIDLRTFQKSLKNLTAVCYYQLDTELLVFVVRAGNSSLKRLALTPEDTDALVAAFVLAQRRDALAGQPLPRSMAEQLRKIPDGAQVSTLLYNKLWSAVENGLRPGERVCILPHLRLHYLPFQSFSGGGKYLVEKHEMFYIPSATAYAMLQARATAANSAVLLVEAAQVADPNSPFHVTETETLQKIYARATLQAAKTATVPAFLKAGPTAGVIHLSCHGHFDPEVPLDSGLALGDFAGDPAELLTARRIYAQRFDKTQLVVMSACVSSVGGLAGGDDVTGITRAFQAAGVPNVIGSLWPVDNAATTQLMIAFHTALAKAPEDPVKALCAAQREMIAAKESIAHWAAFELNGTGVIQTK